MISNLPPGTILQLMYLRNRLRNLTPGKFLEVGPGAGEITALLLSLGWKGTVCDFDETTIKNISNRFPQAVASAELKTHCGSYFDLEINEKFNLIISCMVMEHFPMHLEASFFEKSRSLLTDSGTFINLVPSSMKHWGIEDEIAGHYRRYDEIYIQNLLKAHKFLLSHGSYLTFPISNLLLPVSNFLVRRAEGKNKELQMKVKTKLSGRRNVFLKTYFPDFLKIILNEYFLYPLYLLQIVFHRSTNSLIYYFEAKKDFDG